LNSKEQSYQDSTATGGEATRGIFYKDVAIIRFFKDENIVDPTRVDDNESLNKSMTSAFNFKTPQQHSKKVNVKASQRSSKSKDIINE